MKNLLTLLLVSICFVARATTAVTLDGSGNVINSPVIFNNTTLTINSGSTLNGSFWGTGVTSALRNPVNSNGGLASYAGTLFLAANFSDYVSFGTERGQLAGSFDGVNFFPVYGLENYVPPVNSVSGLANGVRDPDITGPINGLYYLAYGVWDTNEQNYFVQIATSSDLHTWTYLEQVPGDLYAAVSPRWFIDPVSGQQYISAYTASATFGVVLIPNTGNDGHTFGTPILLNGPSLVTIGYDPIFVYDGGVYKMLYKNGGNEQPYHLWTSSTLTGTYTDQGQISTQYPWSGHGEGLALFKNASNQWVAEMGDTLEGYYYSTSPVLNTDTGGASWTAGVQIPASQNFGNFLWDNGGCHAVYDARTSSLIVQSIPATNGINASGNIPVNGPILSTISGTAGTTFIQGLQPNLATGQRSGYSFGKALSNNNAIGSGFNNVGGAGSNTNWGWTGLYGYWDTVNFGTGDTVITNATNPVDNGWQLEVQGLGTFKAGGASDFGGQLGVEGNFYVRGSSVFGSATSFPSSPTVIYVGANAGAGTSTATPTRISLDSTYGSGTAGSNANMKIPLLHLTSSNADYGIGISGGSLDLTTGNAGNFNWYQNGSTPTLIGTLNSSGFTAPGNIVSDAVGSGLQVKEGTNAKQGTGTLVNGVVTIANTSVTANSRIFLTPTTVNASTTIGTMHISAKVAGTSFTVTAYTASALTAATDQSSFNYEIFEPAP